MALRTSERGLKLIKQYEGCRLSSYRCPAGVWTIGYGHTTAAGGPAVHVGMVVDRDEAETIFRDDIDKFENEVEALIGDALVSRFQFDALVSLAFNIGTGAFAKSTVLKRVKSGDFDRVPEAIMWWNKVNGQPVAGLTKRRRAECALFRGDPSGAEKAAPITDPKVDPMPQKVDEPQPPKSIANSTEAQTATVGGLAGAAAAGKVAIDTATDIGNSAKSFGELAVSVGPWVLLAVVIACGAGYLIWKRWKRLHEDRV